MVYDGVHGAALALAVSSVRGLWASWDVWQLAGLCLVELRVETCSGSLVLLLSFRSYSASAAAVVLHPRHVLALSLILGILPCNSDCTF